MTEHQNHQALRYGPAPASAAGALAWLVDQGDRFGQFIGGSFTQPGEGPDSRNPATGEVLATLTQAGPSDIDAAVTTARKAQGAWADMGGAGRARHLRALARVVQDNAQLFSVIEVLDSGQPLRRVRDVVLPLVQRQFEYHAGLAHQMQCKFPGRAAQGVCAVIISDTTPLASLAARLAPALAAGNTVVIKPSHNTTLSALLLADLSRTAGLPDGVFNIVTGDERAGDMLAQHKGVDMIAFEGSTDTGRTIRQLSAGSDKAVTLELDDSPVILVFDDADLDSAIEGIIDGLAGGYGAGAARLLIQESVCKQTVDALRSRMARLRMGNPLDSNTDIGALSNPARLDALAAWVKRAGGQKFVPDMDLPDTAAFYPPTLISGLAPADPVMQDVLRGPVVVCDTFRTQAEALQMANATRYGRNAMIWSEDISRALTIAPKLIAGAVSVNAASAVNPAVAVDSLRDSGIGVVGGPEGLLAYTRRATPSNLNPAPEAQITRSQAADLASLDAAVKSARGALGWNKKSHPALTLSRIAEALLRRLPDLKNSASTQEVKAAADQIFTFAALAETSDATFAPQQTFVLRDTLGVIGMIYSPDAAPLLSLITTLGAALTSGNCAVVVLPETGPDLSKPIMQVLGDAGVPTGVITLLRAKLGDLAAPIAGHMDIDAVWNLSHPDLNGPIEHASARNFKRVLTACGRRDVEDHVRDLLNAASRIRSIHLPTMP